MIFTPPGIPQGPGGTRGALGVRRIKTLHKIKNDRSPILAGVHFIKMSLKNKGILVHSTIFTPFRA